MYQETFVGQILYGRFSLQPNHYALDARSLLGAVDNTSSMQLINYKIEKKKKCRRKSMVQYTHYFQILLQFPSFSQEPNTVHSTHPNCIKIKFNKYLKQSEGAKISMTNLHHIGLDRSKPMGRQQVSPGPRMIPDTCYTRWKPGRVLKEIRNLVERAFRKIRALMKDTLYKEMFCSSRLGLLKRFPIRKRLLHQGGEANLLLLL